MRSPAIIRQPVVSEKSFRLAASGQYSFAVDRRATAADVAHAVERLYSVTVVGVRTLTVNGKLTRYRGHAGQQASWKKAIVALKPGDRIAGFEVANSDTKAGKPGGAPTTGPTSIAPALKGAVSAPRRQGVRVPANAQEKP